MAITSIFFAGCSWGSVYYLGIYKSLLEKIGKEKISQLKIGGNSSGALFATCILLGLPYNEITDIYLEMSQMATKHGCIGKMTYYHNIILNRILKKGNEYQQLTGKLYIGVTFYLDQHRLISKWDSNNDLRNCLHASFHVPVYCTYLPKINNRIVIDGSFGKNFVKLDSNTLIINPLSKRNTDLHAKNMKLTDCIFNIQGNKYNQLINDGYIDMSNLVYKPNIYKQSKSINKNMLKFIWIIRYYYEYKEQINVSILIILSSMLYLKLNKKYSIRNIVKWLIIKILKYMINIIQLKSPIMF